MGLCVQQLICPLRCQRRRAQGLAACSIPQGLDRHLSLRQLVLPKINAKRAPLASAFLNWDLMLGHPSGVAVCISTLTPCERSASMVSKAIGKAAASGTTA